MIRFIRPKSAPRAAVLVLTCFAMTGCGGGGAGGGAAVSGAVTLDGKPMEGGLVSFLPTAAGTAAAAVHAEIQGGTYSLDAAHGPKPGNYRIEITWKKKTGKQIPANDTAGTVEEEVQIIPKKYNLDNTQKVDVHAGENKFDFAVTSK